MGNFDCGRHESLNIWLKKYALQNQAKHTGTLADLEKNLNAFFDAIRLEGDRGEPRPLGFLLRSLVLQGKLDRLPPRLASEAFLGILFGGKLPPLVLSAAVQRNRAEQKVTPERAALLQLFFTSNQIEEVPQMSLDEVTTDAPYRLGRLLSAYEQLQRRAQGGNLNCTLVDRYFGAASLAPERYFLNSFACRRPTLANWAGAAATTKLL